MLDILYPSGPHPSKAWGTYENLLCFYALSCLQVFKVLACQEQLQGKFLAS